MALPSDTLGIHIALLDGSGAPLSVGDEVKNLVKHTIFAGHMRGTRIGGPASGAIASVRERLGPLVGRLRHRYIKDTGKRRDRNMHLSYDDHCPPLWQEQKFPREAWHPSNLWTLVRSSAMCSMLTVRIDWGVAMGTDRERCAAPALCGGSQTHMDLIENWLNVQESARPHVDAPSATASSSHGQGPAVGARIQRSTSSDGAGVARSNSVANGGGTRGESSGARGSSSSSSSSDESDCAP